MDVLRPSSRCNERVLAQAKDTLLENVHRTAFHGRGSSNEQRYAIRTRIVCRDSLHDRLGAVLETAMIALMNDGSSVALGFVPPIPSSRPHAGQPSLAWKQANSSVLRREPAVSAHMDGCPIRRDRGEWARSCPVHKERRRELVLMKLSYRVIYETV